MRISIAQGFFLYFDNLHKYDWLPLSSYAFYLMHLKKLLWKKVRKFYQTFKELYGTERVKNPYWVGTEVTRYKSLHSLGSPLIAKEEHSSLMESTVAGWLRWKAYLGPWQGPLPGALVSTEAPAALSQGPTRNLGGKRSTHVSSSPKMLVPSISHSLPYPHSNFPLCSYTSDPGSRNLLPPKSLELWSMENKIPSIFGSHGEWSFHLPA